MNEDEIRWLVLGKLHEAYLKDSRQYVMKDALLEAQGIIGLPENVVDRTVKYLEQKGLIDIQYYLGGGFMARLNAYGVDAIETRSRPKRVPSPKVFISHSHLDYDKALWIKKDLERYGLTVFVAHKDITPSVEWRAEIVNQIKGCDLFVALLTKNYNASDWCDQECGIAVANGKAMLPVAIELMPYGFLGSSQALFWDEEDIRKNRANLIEAVVSRFGVPTDSLVVGVISSDSFAESGKGLGLLLQRDDMTDDQIQQVAAACLTNDQIMGSGPAQKLLPGFYKKYRDRLPADLRTRFAPDADRER